MYLKYYILYYNYGVLNSTPEALNVIQSPIPFFNKLIETVISSRMLKHIADNELIGAFQSVYRSGHITKTALLRVGITGKALQLLKSCLSDRSHRVLIDDVMSGVANPMCGVPHGSILGPLVDHVGS